MDGQCSRPEAVISSVIQGSVLGPILFIIYIADLASSTSGGILTFADDTKLRRAIESMTDKMALQHDLDQIAGWSRRNNMQLHSDKFEVLNYKLNSTKEQRALPFTEECYLYTSPAGEIIDSASWVKDLGIYMTEDGTWGLHIATTAKEGKRMAGWVLGVFRDRSARTMLTLLKTLVRPKLEYCSPLWSPCTPGDIQRLEDVQRYFTRKIDECQGMNYWERLQHLNVLSLQRRRERYMIIHAWKMRAGLAPTIPGFTFHREEERDGRKATRPKLYRNAQDSVRTTRDASFRMRAALLYNRMPEKVRLCTTIDSLKVELGNFLATIPDYPPIKGYPSTRDNSLVALIKEGI